mmetsp:Transcript_22039/g.30620  ORF Transcript_22039/g.30620 Transcript_22039/m.30620 type:complete len:168 (+) Transcript_22039:442-945(+)
MDTIVVAKLAMIMKALLIQCMLVHLDIVMVVNNVMVMETHLLLHMATTKKERLLSSMLLPKSFRMGIVMVENLVMDMGPTLRQCTAIVMMEFLIILPQFLMGTAMVESFVMGMEAVPQTWVMVTVGLWPPLMDIVMVVCLVMDTVMEIYLCRHLLNAYFVGKHLRRS